MDKTLFSLLLMCFLPIWTLNAQTLGKWGAEDFLYKKRHKGSVQALRCYKVIEDEEDESKKLLSVKLVKSLVRQDKHFFVLATPAFKEGLKVGTYRVHVRMKVFGMLNTLGSAVRISAGGKVREVWMNEFEEEDTFQNFTLDFDVREGDIVTRTDRYYWKSKGGPNSLISPKELPKIIEQIERNDLAWIKRVSWSLAEGDVRKQIKYAESEIPKYQQLIENAIKKADGGLLVYEKDAKEPKLPQNVVTMINNMRRVASNGQVVLEFTKSVTNRSIGSSRGPSTPHPTMRRLVVDHVKLEKLSEPDNIVLREVWPRYPWRRPGEKQILKVWMHNRSASEQKQKLRILLRNGLHNEKVIAEKDIVLAKSRYMLLEHTWNIPKDIHVWGQEVAAQILKGGKVVSEERGWFACHTFSNAVMIHDRPNTRRFTHPYQVPKSNQNHRELFGAACTVNDSAGPVPDPDVFFDPYVVGNGSFWMSIPTLANISKGLENSGIAPFFYCETGGTSQKVFRLYWDDPNMLSVRPSNSDSFVYKRDAAVKKGLAHWKDKFAGKRVGKLPPMVNGGGAYSGQIAKLNFLFKENLEVLTQGVMKLMDHTSLRGVRWDGVPMYAANVSPLGKTFGKSKEEIKKISVENIRYFRNAIRKKYPMFEMAFNSHMSELENEQPDHQDDDAAFAILSKNPSYVEMLKDHGSNLVEYWMHYAGFGAYTNNCRGYLRAAHFENLAMKRAGGHNYGMLWMYDGFSQYTPDEIYQQILPIFAGAHLCASFGPVPDMMYDFGVYASRFGEFFWDPRLRPLRNIADKVSVDLDADIWYDEVGFQRVKENGDMLYVLSFINPPVTEYWLKNTFGQLPDPILEPYAVEVQVPEGYSKAKVTLLDNAPYPRPVVLEAEVSDGLVSFEMPPMKIFKCLAITFSKS